MWIVLLHKARVGLDAPPRLVMDVIVEGESLGLADTGGQVSDLHLPLGDGARHA